MKDLHSANQRVFAEETAMVKLQLNVKRVQIPAFYGMADLQIGDKVRSIIKVKIEKSFFFAGGGRGRGLRRVLKNTPSKHKQLGRSLCIIVILS